MNPGESVLQNRNSAGGQTEIRRHISGKKLLLLLTFAGTLLAGCIGSGSWDLAHANQQPSGTFFMLRSKDGRLLSYRDNTADNAGSFVADLHTSGQHGDGRQWVDNLRIRCVYPNTNPQKTFIVTPQGQVISYDGATSLADVQYLPGKQPTAEELQDIEELNADRTCEKLISK